MINKLASKLPIQQMIANVISDAMEKVAEDESASKKKVKKLVAYEKAEHGHVPSVEEEEKEKTASSGIDAIFIEKLATAVGYIASNFDSINFPMKGVLQKAAEESGSAVGAGKGPGALEVSQAVGGQQNYNLGHAHNIEASSSKAGKPLSGAHEGDSKTQLDNDMHNAPGGGNIAPTAKYPAKGPLVAGPSTKHASIQDIYQSAIKQAGMGSSALGFATQHPHMAAAGAGAALGAAGGAVGAESGHRMGGAAKGALVGGGLGAAASQGMAHSMKTASLRQAILNKLAGEDVMKANITSERSANPLAGMGQLESYDTSQPAPHASGDATGGFGNQARRLIASNQAAIDATKGDAKGPVKTQLSEVLEEPALTSSTDPVLGENLQNTGKAGVKIAAARMALEKVAQQGCTCQTIDRECTFCTLKEKVASAAKSRKGSTKTANAMMGYGGGSSGGMGGGAGGGAMGMGGGMTSMADVGAGSDGCVCGNAGECRVCKLKAALAAAMAQSGQSPQGGMPAASPAEKDSTGAGLSGSSY